MGDRDAADDVAVQRLLRRLDRIGAALAADGRALALLGLGSVGLERDRLDRWSDLDFFVVVGPGAKGPMIEDLSWLTGVAPVAYAFRNTPDGYKLLYRDGVLCELAVFEPHELPGIPFAAGRVVWAQEGFDTTLLRPVRTAPAPPPVDVAWATGEALTALYVGLGRYHRGERLAAARLVQSHAVDRVLEIAASVEMPTAAPVDPFAPERRAERRLPLTAQHLATFVQGYDRTPQSARAVLGWLDEHVDVDPAMRAAVLALCAD
ncbi:hypothetical protein [Actinotalea sp. Marseille-Q4924]|uniref:hypothetical protein n=1 Tax=Actinotalea sp. Marseille-Q4924 TaxID=2866571 RepID=UPI001CE44618|nr:hypothetical protein [Actinotalea sp. Marseille-Q4924]